ncbi:hypothetical protein CVT26_007016 [Gymnopilus dilepis]|uniref:Uncharacterized protein n=1 Tax=Gymnopilus dilepis TaxID=231916 RepID=A0A409W015_9AGAR|nr:hypothetical protein CVT26_007016 [Gymnopilus dilepis]
MSAISTQPFLEIPPPFSITSTILANWQSTSTGINILSPEPAPSSAISTSSPEPVPSSAISTPSPEPVPSSATTSSFPTGRSSLSRLTHSSGITSSSSQSTQNPGNRTLSSQRSQIPKATEISPEPSSTPGAANMSASHRTATIIGVSVAFCLTITLCVVILRFKWKTRRSVRSRGLCDVVVRPFHIAFTTTGTSTQNSLARPSHTRSIEILKNTTRVRTDEEQALQSDLPAVLIMDEDPVVNTIAAHPAHESSPPELFAAMPSVDGPGRQAALYDLRALEQETRSLQRLMQSTTPIDPVNEELGSSTDLLALDHRQVIHTTPLDPPPAYTDRRARVWPTEDEW